MSESDFYVRYVAADKLGGKFPRRTGPFGESAASALASELSRKANVTDVVVERWGLLSSREVSG